MHAFFLKSFNHYNFPFIPIGCTEGPVDLVFVIDGSKSLGEDNFVKNVAKNIREEKNMGS